MVAGASGCLGICTKGAEPLVAGGETSLGLRRGRRLGPPRQRSQLGTAVASHQTGFVLADEEAADVMSVFGSSEAEEVEMEVEVEQEEQEDELEERQEEALEVD